MRMNIGHHLSLESLGGGEKWVINVANDMKRRGHDIKIYSTPIKVAGGIPVTNLDDLLNGIPYEEKLRHNIKGDVNYITYHPMSGLNYNAVGKVIKGIHATSCWEPIDLKYGFLPVQAQILHKFVGGLEFYQADAIHTVASHLPLKHKRIYTIPNFVDSKFFHSSDKLSKFTVVFASRKSYQKGWDIFQQIQDKLKNEDIDFRISGDVKESDMPKFMGEAHVGIVPSRYDSFGLSIVELQMCETYVITSPLPSHKNLTLSLLYADTVDEYVRLILKIKGLWEIDKPSFYSKLLYNRNMAIKYYDTKNIMDRLENMFIEVASL